MDGYMYDNDKKIKILLIDDVVANTRTAAKVLEFYGYQTVEVHSGREALALTKTELPDLILLDIMMPEMTGFETCKELKRDSRTASIPVIFVTALNDIDSITKGFEAGGVDYVVKPFRRAELVMRVKNHLDLTRLQHFFEESTAHLHEKHLQLERSNQELKAVTTRMSTYLSPPLSAMRSHFERLIQRCHHDTAVLDTIEQLQQLQVQMMRDIEALQIMAASERQ
jgi:two-component system, sensor histidine kinase and response regulator